MICIVICIIGFLALLLRPLIVRWYRIRKYYKVVEKEADRVFFSSEPRVSEQSSNSKVQPNAELESSNNDESGILVPMSQGSEIPKMETFDLSDIIKSHYKSETSHANSVGFSGICRHSKNEFAQAIELTTLSLPAIVSDTAGATAIDREGRTEASKFERPELPKNVNKGYISCNSAINGDPIKNFDELP